MILKEWFVYSPELQKTLIHSICSERRRKRDTILKMVLCGGIRKVNISKKKMKLCVWRSLHLPDGPGEKRIETVNSLGCVRYLGEEKNNPVLFKNAALLNWWLELDVGLIHRLELAEWNNCNVTYFVCHVQAEANKISDDLSRVSFFKHEFCFFLLCIQMSLWREYENSTFSKSWSNLYEAWIEIGK